MNKFTVFLISLLALQFTQTAFAYRTEATVRTFAEKTHDDDLVVIETFANTGTHAFWFKSANDRIEIRMTDGSVAVRQVNPNTPGLKPGEIILSSLDKLHDLTVGSTAQLYDMRILFNRDFLWIETRPSGSKTAPVRSSALFFGVDQQTYLYYMRNSIPNVKYANSEQVNHDIDTNYSMKYNPDNINLIHYPPTGKKAILSALSNTIE